MPAKTGPAQADREEHGQRQKGAENRTGDIPRLGHGEDYIHQTHPGARAGREVCGTLPPVSVPMLRKLTALLCALVPLIPLAALWSEPYDCACGMSRDACFCSLVAAQLGAHCDMGTRSEGGKCSLRPLRSPSPSVLLASLDLRGWLPLRDDARPVLAPAGSVPRVAVRASRFAPRSPESPPPRNPASA